VGAEWLIHSAIIYCRMRVILQGCLIPLQNDILWHVVYFCNYVFTENVAQKSIFVRLFVSFFQQIHKKNVAFKSDQLQIEIIFQNDLSL